MVAKADHLTISYKQIASIPIGARNRLAKTGLADAFAAALTPSQRASLFPSYYRGGSSTATQIASLTNYEPTPDATPGYNPGTSPGVGGALPSDNRELPKLDIPMPGFGAKNWLTAEKSKLLGSTRLLDAISASEGTSADQAAKHGFASPYDVPQGYGKYGTPPKPISTMTLSEAYAFGKTMLSNGTNSSAMGRFQITGTTMKEFMDDAGLSWGDTFDAQAQQKLAIAIAKGQGLNAWEGLKAHPELMQIAQQEISAGNISLGENTSGATATPLTAEQIAYNKKGEEMLAATATPLLENGQTALGIAEGRNPNLTDVDPRLKEIVAAGATHLPAGYKVVINDAFREQGTDNRSSYSQHKVKGSGALDVSIMDPSGNIIPNKGSDPTGMYKLLATHAKGEMLARYPELEGKLAYGGAFGTTKSSGIPDLMHFDLGGDRGRLVPENRIANLKLDPNVQYGTAKIVEDSTGLHVAKETVDTATASTSGVETYNLNMEDIIKKIRADNPLSSVPGIGKTDAELETMVRDMIKENKNVTLNPDGTVSGIRSEIDKAVSAYNAANPDKEPIELSKYITPVTPVETASETKTDADTRGIEPDKQQPVDQEKYFFPVNNIDNAADATFAKDGAPLLTDGIDMRSYGADDSVAFLNTKTNAMEHMISKAKEVPISPQYLNQPIGYDAMDLAMRPAYELAKQAQPVESAPQPKVEMKPAPAVRQSVSPGISAPQHQVMTASVNRAAISTMFPGVTTNTYGLA